MVNACRALSLLQCLVGDYGEIAYVFGFHLVHSTERHTKQKAPDRDPCGCVGGSLQLLGPGVVEVQEGTSDIMNQRIPQRCRVIGEKIPNQGSDDSSVRAPPVLLSA